MSRHFLEPPSIARAHGRATDAWRRSRAATQLRSGSRSAASAVLRASRSSRRRNVLRCPRHRVSEVLRCCSHQHTSAPSRRSSRSRPGVRASRGAQLAVHQRGCRHFCRRVGHAGPRRSALVGVKGRDATGHECGADGSRVGPAWERNVVEVSPRNDSGRTNTRTNTRANTLEGGPDGAAGRTATPPFVLMIRGIGVHVPGGAPV